MLNYNEEENTAALEDYAKNKDKHIRPLIEVMKKNGDWDKLVKTMQVLAKL